MDFRSAGNRLALLVLHVTVLAPTAALAAQDPVQQQVETAEQHAVFASKAGTAEQTRLHLHHVINCLVGQDGKGFDASAGNPCKGQGNGALNDLQGKGDRKRTLKQALALARVGVKIQSYEPAHDTASAVDALLK